MDAEKEIKEILKCELKILLDRLKDDFSEKKEKKRNNWILDCFDGEILSNMVFVSSFESKYGNMFEEIIRKIAIINYGKENVPDTIKGVGISEEEYKRHIRRFNKNGQFIISKFDKNQNDRILSQFRANHVAKGNGRRRIPSTLVLDELPNLLKNDFTYSDKIIEQPVDLMFYDPYEKKYNLFEIKAGGNLDSTNSKGNVEKLLKIYSALGYENSKIYFATLYNKDGDENNWKGSVKYQIGEDSLLIGKDFWEKILPTDISFIKFKEIYLDVCEELNFKEEIRTLINEYS